MMITGNSQGYALWVSAKDTREWANKPGSTWPCSKLSGKRFYVGVDPNGLYDFTVNGKDADDIDGVELDAIVSDLLSKDYRHLWPCWETS